MELSRIEVQHRGAFFGSLKFEGEPVRDRDWGGGNICTLDLCPKGNHNTNFFFVTGRGVPFHHGGTLGSPMKREGLEGRKTMPNPLGKFHETGGGYNPRG